MYRSRNHCVGTMSGALGMYLAHDQGHRTTVTTILLYNIISNNDRLYSTQGSLKLSPHESSWYNSSINNK